MVGAGGDVVLSTCCDCEKIVPPGLRAYRMPSLEGATIVLPLTSIDRPFRWDETAGLGGEAKLSQRTRSAKGDQP